MPRISMSPMGTSRNERYLQRPFRFRAVIPVRIIIPQAWEGAPFIALPGAILNISHGGARVQFQWSCPQRSRVLISVPAGQPGGCLPAEVVWGSSPAESRPDAWVYGIRWEQRLSPGGLGSVLAAQGLTQSYEASHAADN
jgi:hypothetical protein